jgi:hypothetical protein
MKMAEDVLYGGGTCDATAIMSRKIDLIHHKCKL